MKIELTEENVLLAGRTYKEGDTLWLALSGTGASFIYTGKKLSITVVGSPVINHEDAENNCARIAVYVNGERKVDDMVTQEEQTYTVWESDAAETVEVKIIKLSESAMSVAGIKDLEIAEGEGVVPAAKKEHLIEFIGDSITCGYGVDDEDPLHPFSTKTEDVTRAYAYLTAQLLSCDCRMFSASGYGIISGYTADPEIKSAEQLIPLYYSSYGFSYDTFPGGKKPMDIPWDFTEKQPDIIVINLGTNDDSYCQETEWKQEEYRDKYAEFLLDVRAKNPGAEIFCVLGLMGARLYPRVCEACRMYREKTGDEKIYTVELPEQDGEKGYVADYHPLHSAHKLAAEKLASEIKSVLKL